LSDIYPDLRFQTVEIGTFTGQISESSKFSLWEIYKLTTCSVPVNVFIENVVLLAKIGSFVVFKLRKEKRWNRKSKYLHPATVATKQPGFVRQYVLPTAKVVGIIAGVVIVLFQQCYQICRFISFRATYFWLKFGDFSGIGAYFGYHLINFIE